MVGKGEDNACKIVFDYLIYQLHLRMDQSAGAWVFIDK